MWILLHGVIAALFDCSITTSHVNIADQISGRMADDAT